ncbi:hypothetical protein [Luteolibacter marinus]|uniref:hypothetical protein n=1 Tax=Luteolibacter marinus TaxID=2776705 RepID=UPI001D025790|nr:hypothetical protein [Luteolibacter marinus]
MKREVGKLASSKITVETHVFTAPAGFGFVPGEGKPAVAGTYAPEVGDRFVKSLPRRRGFDPVGNTPSRSTGNPGEVKLVRDFVYATEYEPPVVKSGVDGAPAAVTPATPTSFETRELGLKMNYTARRMADGRIELKMNLMRSAFLGFVNYGSPITAPAKGLFGRKIEVTLSENRIEMPVFDVKTLKTGIIVNDGDYVAIDGIVANTSTDWPGFSASPDADGLTSGANLVALIQVKAE